MLPKRTIMDWVADGRLPIKTKAKGKETPLINMTAGDATRRGYGKIAVGRVHLLPLLF